jgi:Mn2+/Fe2+ NRAMP family transporter
MIRNLFSIIFSVIAGFFFYMVSLLGFVNEPPAGTKWLLMLIFIIPAVTALCIGLALKGFRNWRKNTGIILISASLLTIFIAFTIACLMLTEEFRQMMKPDTLAFFSDYMTGIAVILGFVIIGWLLIKTNNGYVNHHTLKNTE